MVSFAEQKYNIESLKQLLNAHKIVFTEIDCSLEENKDARNFYFEASGIRANYPQVFLHEADSKQPVYIGSYSEIQVRQRLSCAAGCSKLACRLTHVDL